MLPQERCGEKEGTHFIVTYFPRYDVEENIGPKRDEVTREWRKLHNE
jgi:hypothetical protein